MRVLIDDDWTELHHGCCEGADASMHEITRVLKPDVRIVGHPGTDQHGESPSRAYRLRDLDEEWAPEPYLDRDRVIVRVCDLLVACPHGPEARRSGTWSTIRYARKAGKPILIIWPDGTVTRED